MRLKARLACIAMMAAISAPVSALAADASATVSATIVANPHLESDVIEELARNSWADLLYSGSTGILTFAIPGAATPTVRPSQPCQCRLTGEPAEIAELAACDQADATACKSTLYTERMAELMTCTPSEGINNFCQCEISGSAEQIAALMFCKGTLRGSRVVSLMIARNDAHDGQQPASIIVAYN